MPKLPLDRSKTVVNTRTALEDALAKTETVTFRLSKVDKESIKETAGKLQMSLSEYLVKLHHYAKIQIRG